ncbi:MAG: CDP-glycerol glycerophosphotransferase [Bacteroidetes bacterium HGW-Bacteroidetes-13]|nr:MAG: CDP-glycerol glycerophosphotransferase [Bacteroidetes bacterium HGW-Bacteroidetes-13]
MPPFSYKFLIYISQGYAIPIGKPLETEILKRGYQVYWYSDRPDGKNRIPKTSASFGTIQEAVAYEPHIVLAITDYVADFLTGIKVQIFHGFPANKRKGTDQFQIRGFYDLYCTQGPSSTVPFTEISKINKTFEVVETGWSKMDPMYPLKPKIKSEIPTVLITATCTRAYSLALKDEVLAEIHRLSLTGNWKFKMVIHPLLSEAVANKIKNMQNENFVFLDTTDLIPLYQESDLLFSDTSSAIIEYLLQIKPVVTYKNNMPGPYLIDISKVEEIETAFLKALEMPDNLKDEIQKFADFSHPYTDGKSSERVIDAVIAFLHKDKSHLKRKPLNLIKKYKIRKKTGFFTFKTYPVSFTLPKLNEVV